MKYLDYKIIVVGLFTLSAWSQSAKLRMTVDDYGKWGTLSEEKISPDGRWVSCKMEYQSGSDTLFIVNAKTGKTQSFPQGISARFSPDSKQFAVSFPDNKMKLINIVDHTEIYFSKVVRFDLLSAGKYVLMRNNQSNERELQLFDRSNKVLWQTSKMIDYTIGNDGKLAVNYGSSIITLSTTEKPNPREIFSDTTADASRIVWSRSGSSLAFFSQSKYSAEGLKLTHYNSKTGIIRTLGHCEQAFGDKNYHLEGYGIVISEDDTQIYFNLIPTTENEVSQQIVEVWDTVSRLEYPEQELYKNPELNAVLTVWDIYSGQVQRIDGGDLFHSKILPGGKYTLSESRSSIVSRTDEIPPADYYSTIKATQESRLIVRQGSRSAGAIKVSPSGQYISFFKDRDYYTFDNLTGKTTNITAKVAVDFKNVEFDNAGANPGYYSPGWSADSRFVILYDQFDIWLFSPDGKIAKKITNGKKTKTRYRIVIDRNEMQAENFAEFGRTNIDLKKGIILSIRGYDKSSGYSFFTEKDGFKKINYAKAKFNGIAKAKNTSTYIYTDETENRPPRLLLIDKLQGKPRLIFQSNKQYNNYEWSHSELIKYNNSAGDTLQAILMYPVGYQAGKKYPMVVYIYETLSSTLYEYRNPVVRHRIGFSPTNYLLDGYLVLMPDIKYKVGDPGLSAADCVTSAVANVKQRGMVEENHIGLLGHSYGGYQVSYIITQTSIFAAAVAGGGVTDIVSWYLTMNFSKNRSNNWRFESQQLRMGSSPLNNWSGYVRNSPIANASNITTPLLSWSGKKDTSVNVEQSIELHLALRYLKKPNKMLLYLDQGHILTDPTAQLHLTKNIKDWFDLYLKR